MTSKDATTPFFLILDTDGDGTGTQNANVNGGVTPQTFKYTADLAGGAYIHSLTVVVGDAAAPVANQYGNIAALGTGVGIQIGDAVGGSLDLLEGLLIQQNRDWTRVTPHVAITPFGTGVNHLTVRWDFVESAGAPIFLPTGYEFQAVVNDDLTGLTDHYFLIGGRVDASRGNETISRYRL